MMRESKELWNCIKDPSKEGGLLPKAVHHLRSLRTRGSQMAADADVYRTSTVTAVLYMYTIANHDSNL